MVRGGLLAALLLLTAGLTGCVGASDLEMTEAPVQAEDRGNPWQAGLADTYPTPAVAEHRSSEERRANLAPPGDPTFAEFDAAFQAFMEANRIPTGQVAIMHEGELRYTRGYGYADAEGTESADADTMFRVASITKPMTAAVVTMQVEQGMYDWTDPVFCVPPNPAPNCLLPIQPHPEFPVVDEDLNEVTVRHLLDHTGGWGRTMDPIFFGPAEFWEGDDTITIADKMGIASPPPAWRLAQYLMGQEIEDPPGERYWYCNVCYMLAGLVAESATGATMQALYDAYLFDPLEIQDDIEIGRTLPDQRNPREAHYPCEFGKIANVFAPNETVCWADGGWSMQTVGALGGVVATAEAVAAVYELYVEHGFERAAAGPFVWAGHTGALPGTATMTGTVEDEDTLTGEVQYVALFNKMGSEEPLWPYLNAYNFEAPLLALTAGWGATENLQEVGT